MTINERVSDEPMTHDLKIYPEFFSAVATGVKRAELRKNDRAYRVGDKLHLMETPRGSCHSTGEYINATITHIADVNEWIPGYVLLSIERELQQYRAAAEPVAPIWGAEKYPVCRPVPGSQIIVWDETGKFIGCGRAIDTCESGIAIQMNDGHRFDSNHTIRWQYALQQYPQVTSVPEELLSAMEDVLRISDRDHDAWNRAKYAIAAIRSAPAVQAEQEPVSQPYTLPEPITRNDADGWRMYKGRRVGGGCAEWYNRALDDCRAAIASGNSPAIPEGYALVPSKLTAENGAKGALSGEFSETKFISCPECFGDDECETCDGSGRIEITVPVSWTTIKEIWAKGVEHFAAAPKQEAE
ncbi:DUF3850 domain-containing protein [Atlantibacter hermannii]|uniref:DUF3850 domain-containing protein n=1 Tax=Atlantibacter hermannii TaxID=565 RepID=UPI0028A78265|nr:DUF3850 domain-containing protein [Atlantibacter hermannii]